MPYNLPGAWSRVALLNFFVAALLGALLRLAFVVELPWLDFRNWLHAHSHVAMLGWAYLALYAGFVPAFLTEDRARAPYYRRLFWLTQGSVLGMLFSFPAQGYGPVSIAFSTLHILLSYAFAYRFLTDLRQSAPARGPATRLARAALWFMMLSTLGVWALGPVMGLGLRDKIGFILAVQFFLHFQIFGWFLFGVLALFFRWAEDRGAALSGRWENRFFGLLVSGTLFTFGLVLTWAYAWPSIYGLNDLGAVLLLAAVGLLVSRLWPRRTALLTALPSPARYLLVTALAALVLGVVLRGLTLIPAVATISYTLRNFTVGFLHLVLLGVVSTFLLGYALPQRPGKRTTLAVILFLAGVIGSEGLLFGQGVLLWSGVGFIPLYYELLFGLSALMPVGLLLLLLNRSSYPVSSNS